MLEIRICDGKELEISRGSHVYWNSGLGRDTYRKWSSLPRETREKLKSVAQDIEDLVKTAGSLLLPADRADN